MKRRGVLFCAAPAVALAMAGVAGWLAASGETSTSRISLNTQNTLAQAREALERQDLGTCGSLLQFHLQSNPKDAEGLFVFARYLKERGRNSEAAEVVLSLVASNAFPERRLVEGIQLLNHLVRSEPSNAVPLKALAFLLDRCDDSMGALSAAHRALALDPADPAMVKLMTRAAEESAAAASPRPLSPSSLVRPPNAQSPRRRLPP